jgi:eukaryotic-like serine/threonine-protein kinase
MAVEAARAKSLFLAASELDDPAERAAYLDRECGGDAELRARVEALLRAHADPPPSEATGAHEPGRPEMTEDYAATEPEPGVVVAGKYKLSERIGEGAWAASGSPTRPSRSDARSRSSSSRPAWTRSRS